MFAHRGTFWHAEPIAPIALLVDGVVLALVLLTTFLGMLIHG